MQESFTYDQLDEKLRHMLIKLAYTWMSHNNHWGLLGFPLKHHNLLSNTNSCSDTIALIPHQLSLKER